jgi:bifunctional non-homologous end joining protein LigD
MPQGIEPSNLGKVFWPEAGLTKGDLLNYYDAVSSFVIPAIRSRPLTVKRYPDGIDGMTFFQKNTPAYAPSWVKTVKIHAGSAKRDVHYPLCNTKRTLMWLANQACIELHPWISRADHLERPDYLVFDLDPPDDGFDQSVDMAFLVKEVMDEAGIQAALKTSGAKGVHVYAPLQRRYHYGQVRVAARNLAARVEERWPDLATTDFSKSTRRGRVLLDTNRNAPGQHIVAPYSPRARPAASVSFPVTWKELRKVRPEDFTIRNVPGLLERKGDLWKKLMPRSQSIPRELLVVE